MITSLLIILITILASAFFSGMEIAFLTANKLRIELESNQGYIPAKVLSFFLKKPQRFIATVLVGNNTSLVIYGIYTSLILKPIFEHFIHSHIVVLLLSVLISTFLIVITAEFLPKALFRINPNAILNFFAVPFIIIYYLLFPVMFITLTLAEIILKYGFRMDVKHNQIAFGRIDLDNYVKQFISNSDKNQEYDHEIQIFQNALDFGSVKARECMVPRPEIIALEVNDEINTLQNKFIETHLSKILIYEENIDHIIGYVHSSEMFKRPETIRQILLPVAIVPETMQAKNILALLKQQRRSIAIVVDEFGGTAGILTIEDVMEEIFGEIDDEHDKDDLTEKMIDENHYVFSGRIEIDYINEKYRLQIPVKEDYETLAGFILHHHGSLPHKNEQIIIDNFQFKIQSVSGNRIDMVELKLEE